MRDGKEKKKPEEGIDRRKFLQYVGATGAALALSDIAFSKARAVDIKRLDSTGKVHILGCNEMTSTHGYWDNSTKTVLAIQSGDTAHVETGVNRMGEMM